MANISVCLWLFGSHCSGLFYCFWLCINFQSTFLTPKSANQAKSKLVCAKTVGGISKVILVAAISLQNPLLLFQVLSPLFLGLLWPGALLPAFNAIAAKSILFFPGRFAWFVPPFMVGLACLIGIMAGMYPCLLPPSSFSTRKLCIRVSPLVSAIKEREEAEWSGLSRVSICCQSGNPRLLGPCIHLQAKWDLISVTQKELWVTKQNQVVDLGRGQYSLGKLNRKALRQQLVRTSSSTKMNHKKVAIHFGD